jgi:Putative zinc-finger
MTKTCDLYAELISAMADGELAGDKLKELQAHLESCAACRVFLKECQRINHAMQDVPAAPPVADARWQAMASDLKAMRKIDLDQRSARLFMVRALAFVAAAAAVCLIAIILWKETRQRDYLSAKNLSNYQAFEGCISTVVHGPEDGINMVLLVRYQEKDDTGDNSGKSTPVPPENDKAPLPKKSDTSNGEE